MKHRPRPPITRPGDRKAKVFQYTREQTSETQSKALWLVLIVIVAGFAYLFESSQMSGANRKPASTSKKTIRHIDGAEPVSSVPSTQNPVLWELEREPRIR